MPKIGDSIWLGRSEYTISDETERSWIVQTSWRKADRERINKKHPSEAWSFSKEEALRKEQADLDKRYLMDLLSMMPRYMPMSATAEMICLTERLCVLLNRQQLLGELQRQHGRTNA